MLIDCPYTEKSHVREVEIMAGICDMVDLCKYDKRCRFYDDTVEGTIKYQKASRRCETLEGWKEHQLNPNMDLEAELPDSQKGSGRAHLKVLTPTQWQAKPHSTDTLN